MGKPIPTHRRIEFGDFQTPRPLAQEVCALLQRDGMVPASLFEPTCGRGELVRAAIEAFPSLCRIVGLDINPGHLADARETCSEAVSDSSILSFVQDDFFGASWPELLSGLPEPLLILGNPPWVTNAALGALGSANLPLKSNFHSRSGLDAMTGKSNFDISEWMLSQMLEWTNGRDASVAMLCKTAVARKVLEFAWSRSIPVDRVSIHRIDARTHFEAAVDACLLRWSGTTGVGVTTCRVFEDLRSDSPCFEIGYRDGHLIADIDAYETSKHLLGKERARWRSGIKHDCSPVMELVAEAGAFRNGLGETVELEPDYLFPMLKSSGVANGETEPRRWMIVPQRTVGEDTASIATRAPKTWEYLDRHSEQFARRASSIYRNRPRFSIFGVGDYSFAPWKVAISGFYKRLAFRIVGPHQGKPVVFDDTCYFVPCQSRQDAELLASLLGSTGAKSAFRALIFWDAKRPITAEVLHRVDIVAIARDLELPDREVACMINGKHRLGSVRMASSSGSDTVFIMGSR